MHFILLHEGQRWHKPLKMLGHKFLMFPIKDLTFTERTLTCSLSDMSHAGGRISLSVSQCFRLFFHLHQCISGCFTPNLQAKYQNCDVWSDGGDDPSIWPRKTKSCSLTRWGEEFTEASFCKVEFWSVLPPSDYRTPLRHSLAIIVKSK